MKFQNTLRGLAYLILLTTSLSPGALAQSANKLDTVAAVTADQTEVKWRPQVEFGRLILTISTPGGEVVRQEFETGADPSFKLIDKEGFKLPDGQYMYELRVIPKLSKEARTA